MGYHVSNFFLTYFPKLESEIYSLPAWYWVSLLTAFVLAYFWASALTRPLILLGLKLFDQKTQVDKNLFLEKLSGPGKVLGTLALFLFLNAYIKEPEHADATISVAKSLAWFFGFTYFLYKIVDLIFARLTRAYQSPRSKISLVIPLLRRVCKTVLIATAFLLLLSHFGVDVSALLVGLGVGGLAIALAAQKILENLFGGVVLSLDQPFQVGDYCKCGDILGYIEEIGIRSTRIRTLDRTLISIPNSKLSEVYIENYMEREKIRFYQMIRIDLYTSLELIQEFLSACEKIMLQDDNFHHDFHRVRLFGINEKGIEIELYSFFNTTDFSEFVAMREQYLMAVLKVMADLGIKHASMLNTNILEKS